MLNRHTKVIMLRDLGYESEEDMIRDSTVLDLLYGSSLCECSVKFYKSIKPIIEACQNIEEDQEEELAIATLAVFSELRRLALSCKKLVRVAADFPLCTKCPSQFTATFYTQFRSFRPPMLMDTGRRLSFVYEEASKNILKCVYCYRHNE